MTKREDYKGRPTPGKRGMPYNPVLGQFDLHPTPEEFTQVLLSQVSLPKRIWEPACGTGALSIVLEAAGCYVYSSDLAEWGYGHTGVDFLEKDLSPPPQVEAIITNPPFGLAMEFVERALDYLDNGQIFLAAFILKIEFLAGLARHKRIFCRRKPTKVIIIPNRMRNQEKGWSYSFWHAWFIWEPKKVKYTKVEWRIANE